MPDNPNFTAAELSALDSVITHLQSKGVGANEPTPLTTAVIAVVAQATLATVAVLCTKVPEDNDKLQQIASLASQLKSTTTLNNLMELRSRAVKSIAQSVRSS